MEARVPLPDLPQPVLLLHLAQLHLHQAHQLIPQLTIRPTQQYHLIGTLHYKQPSTQHTTQLAWAASTYRQHITIAIGCLRSILTLAQTSQAESISTELNLLTRCKLIHVLLSETREHQQAFNLVQQGLNLARQRDHLTPFRLILSQFLINIQISDPTISFRQIKKHIDHAIELTIKNNVVDQKYISWYYRFQLLVCHISYERAKDFPAALAALRNVLTLAELRNDWELWIACKVHEIKMAMDRCEWPLVSELFKLTIPMVEFNLEAQTSLATSDIPSPLQNPPNEKIIVGQQLKAYIMMLLIIFYSTVGETQLAKGWVKHLRTELDSPKQEEGQSEGTFKIYLKSYSPQIHQRQMAQFSPLKTNKANNSSVPLMRNLVDENHHPGSLNNSPNPNVNSQYVIVSIMSKEVMYTLTYLISLAVYFDGHGKSPKSLIYAQEGLKQIDRQLTMGFQSISNQNHHLINNKEFEPPNYSYYPPMITCIKSWLKTLLAMKLETNFAITQLAVVRSDFLQADQLLVEIIRRVSDAESWEIYNGRVSFLKCMLSHATGNLGFARQSILTTLHLVKTQTKLSNAERLSYADDLCSLSKVHYILIRMAETTKSLALDHLIKDLSLASQLSIPAIDMAIQVVLAMSCGEIVKAKHHLTVALNQANKTSNSHLKMILLGLLSTMFLNTRSDQATNMLKSCFKLSLGFSSSSFSTPPPTTTTTTTTTTTIIKSSSSSLLDLEKQKSLLDSSNDGYRPIGVNDIVVGNPSLGLWVGKKLVDIYESQESGATTEEEKKSLRVKIQRMKLSNLAHQNSLDQTPLL